MKERKPEEKQKVPAYIVTFSDMVTLLLTFFLMLLSMASEQSPELFNAGKASFIRAIETLGFGMIMGPKIDSELGEHKPIYKIQESEPEQDTKMIDPEQQRLQRSIRKLNEYLKNESQSKKTFSNHTIVTSIKFGKGSDQLSIEGKEYLDDLSGDFRTGEGVSLYVVGMPGKGEKDIATASRRAESVSRYLKSKIRNQAVSIYSMGADSSWFGKKKRKDDSHIWISAVKENNRRSNW